MELTNRDMGWKIHDISDPRLRQRIEDADVAAKRFGVGGVKPREAVGLEVSEKTDLAGQLSEPSPSSRRSTRPSISTDEAKLNKTERRFLGYLRDCHWCFIGIQNHTLKLADDCRYTPDFFGIKAGPPTFFEVKGFWRDDARVKIKVAARMFPWARFVAVQWGKHGWKFEEIKP